jgi:inosose dehydratase|tara:strand:- start:397 stop:564 length:168 start_codon:yes stop_codon:yes gene_type:complete
LNVKTEKILKKKNYSGWLVVEAEQDPQKANPLEYAIKGYKYLAETLSNLKVEIEK